MKGIYLTEEGKKEIEAKIAELQIFSPLETDDDFLDRGKQIAFEEILSSATILPVEESCFHRAAGRQTQDAGNNNTNIVFGLNTGSSPVLTTLY